MIFYLYTEPHRYTIEQYFLDHWAPSLGKRVRLISYDAFSRQKAFPFGTYIFSDFDRLDWLQQEDAAHIWNSLNRHPADFKLVNHPTRSLRRYPLLRKLYEEGINEFNVYRLTEQRYPSRFPVFIRDENDHQGKLTDLLESQSDLDAAMEAMLSAGASLDNKLIVEYVDTRQGDGRFHKHGVFRVGDQIVPQHVFFGDDWYVKRSGGTAVNEEDIGLELSICQSNPYQGQLFEIFEKAGVEYGRVDFSLKDGRIQVFEINSNPHIMTSTADRSFPRSEIRELAARALEKALLALDIETDQRKSLEIDARTNPIVSSL